MKSKSIPSLILFSWIIILMLHSLNLIKEKKLVGSFVSPQKPSFTAGSWGSGSYQDSMDLYINTNLPFHNALVRVFNSYNYHLFNELPSNGTKLVIGKDGSFLEESHINSYFGLDRLPDSVLLSKLALIERVQKKLKARNVHLVFGLVPNKAYFQAEDIPDSYEKKGDPEKSNYRFIKQSVDKFDINFIDIGNVFETNTKNKNIGYYPKYGGHCSSWGNYLIMDTIVNIMADLKKLNQRYSIVFDSMLVRHSPLHRENDLSNLANLIYTPEQNAYYDPVVKNNENIKFWTVFIGDSFLANIIQERKYDPFFQTIKFWYYFSSEYSNGLQFKSKITDIKSDPQKVLDIVSQYSFIIILQTDTNVDLGFNFFETIDKVL